MTAVKWLVKEFARYYAIHQLKDEIDQALEMEKQQMEISDEEIVKAADAFEYTNGIYGFKQGVKWYREQLKQRK
jgi:hypothetical protein